MSAMPARAPRVTQPAPRRRASLSLVRPLVAPVVGPIVEAIPIRVPQGRANNRQFSYIIFGMLISGLMLLLLVNTFVTQVAFEKHTLQIQVSQKMAERQALETTIATAESPDNLITAARRMGMVPAANPVFLRLSDQKILGEPVAAKGQRVVRISTNPQATQATR